jgi:signal transduction histidine kinase
MIIKQFGFFLAEDIDKEKEIFIENLKSILERQTFVYSDAEISNTNINVKEKAKIERLSEINDLLTKNKYIVSCVIFFNRALVFSYNKSSFDFLPMPPPRMDNPNPTPGQFGREKNFMPPKLKAGFFMEQYIFRVAPLRIFTINMIFYNEAAKRFMEKIRLLFLVFYIILLIISFPLSYFISKQFTKPIRNLAKKTINLTNGNYGETIEDKNSDEIGLLVDAFNKLSMQLKNDQEFRKRITSEITHDISTPINIIRSYIYGIKDGIIKISPETIMAIDGEIDRITELVDQINLFSSKKDINQDLIPLISVDDELEIYIEKVLYLFNKENIEIRKEIDKDILFKIRRNHLRSLIENILKNSISHNNSHIKTLEVYLYKKEKADRFKSNLTAQLIKNGYGFYSINQEIKGKKEFNFSLIIKDNGVGIPKDELSLIFERFYKAKNGYHDKTKKVGGVGLSIVKEICNLYDLNLEIYSLVGEGTVIILNF